MTKYNLDEPEDRHFYNMEMAYYRELDEAHAYEIALEQYARGELSEKPDQPFLVFV